jgi:Thiamine pyrophosphate-requiring enzymes [acetolactate synthase, pyruvate dehydrogenase (cytochrome), glyoxylate carboligase, phosphonopyruvate decarboxylase]
MARITGGEVLKRVLEKEGVRYVFGVPGDQLYPFLNALYDSNIKFVTFHHEANAAHAADAWARITGELGVVIATVGPGAANLIGGVYPAFAENIPILVMTAQNQTFRSYPDFGSMQALDQLSLFKAVTKWNVVINHWNRIVELTQRAIRIAMSGKPGPVHIDFPTDILHQTGDEEEIKIHEREKYRPVKKPIPDLDSLKKIAMMLINAERPLIHAGGGVLRAKASKELIELAEYLQIPVTASVSGRGCIPEDHPLCLVPHSYGAIAAQNEADLVLLIGSKLGDLDLFGRPPIWGDYATQKFIQIDIDAENIALNRPIELGVIGDAKETLSVLLDIIKKEIEPKNYRERNRYYKELEKQWIEQFEKIVMMDQIPIHPLRVIHEVRAFYPRNAIAVIDGGNTTVWAHYLNRAYEPNTFLSSATGDSGHLGSCIGYAIAARLANPEREVYCITGDGAFSMGIAELETAKRLGLQITFVVLNDSAWGMIKAGQTLYYEKRYIGVDFGEIRYDLIAKAMGCYGERIEDPKEIRGALERAKLSGFPAVLDIKIDREVIPPDFQTLAMIWLEGCEPSPKISKKKN